MAASKDERTLGDMFAELSRETRTLVQQEIQLAKTELTEKAAKLAKSVVIVVAGALIAHGGLLAIVATIVLALIATGLPAWAAALLGGILILGIGYLLIRWGLAGLRRQDLKPHQTLEMLKEDARWLRAHTK
jgi:uncharacterized membrane protein YqjE